MEEELTYGEVISVRVKTIDDKYYKKIASVVGTALDGIDLVGRTVTDEFFIRTDVTPKNKDRVRVLMDAFRAESIAALL